MILPPHCGQARPRVVRRSTSIASGLSLDITNKVLSAECDTADLVLSTQHSVLNYQEPSLFYSLLYLLNAMKNPQNIATGGANSTKTPRLKFLIKFGLFDPASEARHIEHCVSPVVSSVNTKATANPKTNATLNVRARFINDSPPQVRAATL